MENELKVRYKAKDYIESNRFFHRKQWLFKFDNNYGASVVSIKTQDGRFASYGNKEKPYELGVVYCNEVGNYDLTFVEIDGVCNEVFGYLNDAEVEKILEKIERL